MERKRRNRRVFAAALAVAAAAPAMLAMTPVQRQFLRSRTRIVSADTQSVPGHVVYRYARGSEMWSVTNALSRANTPPARPVRYSKLRLIRALRSRGKWAELRAFLQAHEDLRDDWYACVFIQSDDPAFILATNAAVSAGIGSTDEIRAVLRESEDAR